MDIKEEWEKYFQENDSIELTLQPTFSYRGSKGIGKTKQGSNFKYTITKDTSEYDVALACFKASELYKKMDKKTGNPKFLREAVGSLSINGKKISVKIDNIILKDGGFSVKRDMFVDCLIEAGVSSEDCKNPLQYTCGISHAKALFPKTVSNGAEPRPAQASKGRPGDKKHE